MRKPKKATKTEAKTTPIKLPRAVRVTDIANVRQTFLQLTHRTCPHGFEDLMYTNMLTDLGFRKDNHGNFWLGVGTPEQQRIMFASHMDTVGSKVLRVNHTFDKEKRVVYSDGKTILGADDKAGMAIMLYLLSQNVAGTYYFFVGEEVGCIGSKDRAQEAYLYEFDAVVSFDRMGYKDVITHQAGTRTCSDEFAASLAEQLNTAVSGFEYKASGNGVYTDSREFIDKVPECTNVSVGYFKQHGFNECQDLAWLEWLAYGLSKVKWEELPIKRDPTVKESRWSNYSWSGYGHTSKTTLDNNLDRVLGDDSGMLDYYETKYGIKPEELPMTDVLELFGCMTDDEFENWIYCNLEKTIAFVKEIFYQYPKACQGLCETVDRSVN